jgi:hypothetical protein
MNRTQLQSALRSLVVPYSGLTSEKMALILQRRLAWAETVKGLSLESMTVAQLRDLYRQSGYQKYWRAKTKDELVRGIRWLAGKSVSFDTRPRPKQSRGDEWVSLVFTHPRTGRRVALVTEQMSPAEAARAKPQYFIDRHRRAFGTWRFAQWYPWYDPDFQVSYDGAPMSDEELSDLEALIRDDPHDPAIRRVFEDDPHGLAIRRGFEARRNPSFTVADAQRALDALGVRPRGYTAADLARGMNVELEHRDVTHADPLLTARVALAHLRESPRYYDELARMEQRLRRACVIDARGRKHCGTLAPKRRS